MAAPSPALLSILCHTCTHPHRHIEQAIKIHTNTWSLLVSKNTREYLCLLQLFVPGWSNVWHSLVENSMLHSFNMVRSFVQNIIHVGTLYSLIGCVDTEVNVVWIDLKLRLPPNCYIALTLSRKPVKPIKTQSPHWASLRYPEPRRSSSSEHLLRAPPQVQIVSRYRRSALAWITVIQSAL